MTAAASVCWRCHKPAAPTPAGPPVCPGHTDPEDPCPLCVQWRCSICKSQDWPYCCDYTSQSEAIWADGTVVPRTRTTWCRSCTDAVAEYQSYYASSAPY